MTTSDTDRIPSVAVVGSGYWGKNLVRNFHQLGALRLICDKNETIIAQFKKQHPEVDVCSAFAEMLGLEQIGGVVIATPAETHFTLAREALLAGKHVFVEKPLALTVEEGEKLVELADRHGLILMVGHILHYHPAVVKLQELIGLGELGKIQYLYSNRLNIGRIRAEENILWSFAPHDISVILMLLGEMPETVWASGGSYLQRKIPDTTLTTLDFPSGVKAHIFVSWLHPVKEQKLVVVGDEKMAGKSSSCSPIRSNGLKEFLWRPRPKRKWCRWRWRNPSRRSVDIFSMRFAREKPRKRTDGKGCGFSRCSGHPRHL
jgi:UDP-2-acetamido-3-amino-2,3-dideoxy-glucuronate N-acetyltransferase